MGSEEPAEFGLVPTSGSFLLPVYCVVIQSDQVSALLWRHCINNQSYDRTQSHNQSYDRTQSHNQWHGRTQSDNQSYGGTQPHNQCLDKPTSNYYQSYGIYMKCITQAQTNSMRCT